VQPVPAKAPESATTDTEVQNTSAHSGATTAQEFAAKLTPREHQIVNGLCDAAYRDAKLRYTWRAAVAGAIGATVAIHLLWLHFSEFSLFGYIVNSWL